MSSQVKLVDQLTWCINSKKALGNFYAACTEAQKDIQRTFITLQDTNFAECNRELMELNMIFQQVTNELTANIITDHLPYLQKQIDGLKETI